MDKPKDKPKAKGKSRAKGKSKTQGKARSRRTGASQNPRIRSSVNPVTSIFNPRDLPKELIEGVDIKEDIVDAAQIDAFQILSSWLNHKYPTMLSKQDCRDVINNRSYSSNSDTEKEIFFGAKLSLIAYSMPFYFPQICTHLHMRNDQFVNYLEGFVAESAFLAYQNMDMILEGDLNMIALPPDTQVSGFYVRTPIQIWNRQKRRVYKIPSWEKRDRLLKTLIIGNVNVYVLRRNLEDGYECYVLFRGTSNEFNAIPQYGDRMTNTQLYRVPMYDPSENKFYETGSQSVPLFYYYYSDMIDNVMPHIVQCLDWLHASDPGCQRIVVAGHSMGAALTLTFCYLWKLRHPDLWAKTFFRSYASPICCNDAAVMMMEQWMIDSMQPDKFLEVVNTDDFVNVQYLLGGKKGLKNAIKSGTNSIGSWLVSNYMTDTFPPRAEEPVQDPDPDPKTKKAHESENKSENKSETSGDSSMIQRMMRIIQVYPEIAFSAFMNGALTSQIQNVPDEKKAGFRIGQRKEEIKLWGSRALKSTYNNTLKLFFCQRRINWNTEYLGKSHSNYVDINMNIFWAPLRMYEDHLYRYYASHSLRHNNRLRVVGMFPATDVRQAGQLIEAYSPPKQIPRLLSLQNQMKKLDQDREKRKPIGNEKDEKIRKRPHQLRRKR